LRPINGRFQDGVGDADIDDPAVDDLLGIGSNYPLLSLNAKDRVILHEVAESLPSSRIRGGGRR